MSCQQLKTHMIEFIDDISSIFTRKEDLNDLEMIKLALDVINDEELMKQIISTFLPFKKQIVERDLMFFKNNKNKIFIGIDQKRIDYFDKKITAPPSEGGISAEDKESIWAYFDVIIDLAEEYKKVN
jgi:hypothetical protein